MSCCRQHRHQILQ